MSADGAVLGGETLRRLDRRLSVVEDALTMASGWIIFALMLLGIAQIFLRSIVGQPILGYIDYVELGMVVFAIGAIGYCQRLGGHVRMEIALKPLKGRVLWAVEAIGVAVAFFVIVVLAYYAYFHFQRAWQYGDSTIDIELPNWPAKLFVPIVFAILAARLALQFWGYARLAIRPDAEPIAVVLMENVEAQARREIEETEIDHDAEGDRAP